MLYMMYIFHLPIYKSKPLSHYENYPRPLVAVSVPGACRIQQQIITSIKSPSRLHPHWPPCSSSASSSPSAPAVSPPDEKAAAWVHREAFSS